MRWALGLQRRFPVLFRLLATVVLTGVALVVSYHLPEDSNFQLAGAASAAIVILGLSFLTGYSGQVSIGNGAFMGVGAFATAIWSAHHRTTPVVAVLAISVLAGAAAGFVVGLPATRLRGPYLAGMTLAVAFSFQFIAYAFPSWTGGDFGLNLPSALTPPRWLTDLFSPGTSTLRITNMWLADVSIVAAGVAFFLMANLFQSRTGRAMRLVRDNDVAAELVGISLPRTRIVAFVVSAACAGLGGGLFALTFGSVDPATFNLILSINLLAVVVIGGIGTLSGAMLAAVIYTYAGSWVGWIVSTTGLNTNGNTAQTLQQVIFGALLIIVMLLAPRGIAGTLKAAVLGRRGSGMTRPKHARQ